MLLFPSDLRCCLKMADALIFSSLVLVLLINNKVIKKTDRPCFCCSCLTLFTDLIDSSCQPQAYWKQSWKNKYIKQISSRQRNRMRGLFTAVSHSLRAFYFIIHWPYEFHPLISLFKTKLSVVFFTNRLQKRFWFFFSSINGQRKEMLNPQKCLLLTSGGQTKTVLFYIHYKWCLWNPVATI